MIQLYGRFSGYWSHAQVSRGLTYGLAVNGMLDLQIFNPWLPARHWTGWRAYEGLTGLFSEGGYRLSVSSGLLVDAPVGFWVGGYPPLIQGALDDHPFRAALVLAESSRLPEDWVRYLYNCHMIAVPSAWVRDVYAEAGVPRRRLIVVPHGIHPLYVRAPRPLRPQGRPLLLHISGARDFPERKGTLTLIKAWQKAFGPEAATLVIRTPPSKLLRQEAVGRPDIIFDDSNEALAPHAMLAYLARGWTALVQPSRGEAFGIVPVEARALGVPVVLTHCTGHLEHACPEVDYVVPHGPDEELQTQGVLDGLAPSVSVDALAEVLVEVVGDSWKNKLRVFDDAQRKAWALRWQWPEVTRTLAKVLRGAVAECKHPHRRLQDDLLGG